MNRQLRTAAFAAIIVAAFMATTATAQRNAQSDAADKKATFTTVAKTDKLYTDSIDAHELDKAKDLEGKKGSFKELSPRFSPEQRRGADPQLRQ